MTNAKPTARPLNDQETDLLADLLTSEEVRLRSFARDLPADARLALMAVADDRAALRDLLYSNLKATIQAEMVRAEQQAESEERRAEAMGLREIRA